MPSPPVTEILSPPAAITLAVKATLAPKASAAVPLFSVEESAVVSMVSAVTAV